VKVLLVREEGEEEGEEERIPYILKIPGEKEIKKI
jgi:hypothetical protein